MKESIKSFGFEIEGEFALKVRSDLEDYGIMKTDGSVQGCNNCYILWKGEFNSKPYLREDLNSAYRFFKRLQKEYENGNFHFNHTCGFHIHLKFRPLKPPKIFSIEFPEYFNKRMKKELNGVWKYRKGNHFCRFDYNEDEIAKLGGARYKAVNFTAFSSHKTVEFRIFPSAQPMLMYQFLKFTLETTEAFLKTEVKKELKAKYALDFQAQKTKIPEIPNEEENPRIHKIETSTKIGSEKISLKSYV